MRSLDEINADALTAIDQHNVDRLFVLADEVELLVLPEAQARMYKWRGIATRWQHKYSEALVLLERAYALFNELGNERAIAGMSMNIGNVFMDIADLSNALVWFHKALDGFQVVGELAQVARTSVNIGIVHSDLGSYPEAMVWYERAAALLEEVQDVSALGRVYHSIGQLYISTSILPKALEYFERSIPLFEKVHDDYSIGAVYNDIGNVHSGSKNSQEALKWFQLAEAHHFTIGDNVGLVFALANIGDVHYTNGDLDEARRYYEKALDTIREGGLPDIVHTVHVSMCSVLIDLGLIDDARNRFAKLNDHITHSPKNIVARLGIQGRLNIVDGDLDAASASYLKAIDEARTHGLRGAEASYHKELRDVAQQRNDLAAYIEHNNAYTSITEEISGKETALKLAMHSKEKEIRAEREERERERAILYGALPRSIADRMIRGDDVSGDHYNDATVMFLDVVGFTSLSDRLSAEAVIQLLENIFIQLDNACTSNSVTKIKTIGDAYLAVAFPRIEMLRQSNESR